MAFVPFALFFVCCDCVLFVVQTYILSRLSCSQFASLVTIYFTMSFCTFIREGPSFEFLPEESMHPLRSEFNPCALLIPFGRDLS